jgi:hypothetical protein
MEKVIYRIKGSRFGAQFEFSIMLEGQGGTNRNPTFLGRKGKWSGYSSKALGPQISDIVTPGGEWDFRKPVGGAGFIFLTTSGRGSADIALDKVPDDFMHGPFCSSATGKGTLWPSPQESIPIEWTVQGPGCI